MNISGKKITVIGVGVLALTLGFYVALTQTHKTPIVDSAAIAIEETDTTDLGILTTDDPWAELRNLMDAYSFKGGMKYSGTMKLIDDNGEKEKEVETARFEYQVKGEDYYYLLGDVEVVSKRDVILLADHINKVITISSVHIQKSKKNVFDFSDFEKMLKETNAKASVTQRGNEKVLTVDSIGDERIQGYRIYYDPVSYSIHRMVIGMARPFSLEEDSQVNSEKETVSHEKEEALQDPMIKQYDYYLVLTYSLIEKLSLKSGEFNPEKRFFKSNMTQKELTNQFKGYTVLNNEEEPDLENSTEE